MDIQAKLRSRVSVVAVPEQAASNRRPRRDTPVLQVRLLGDSVRAAGQFQRSALGHMDHENWLERVLDDGQRLVDLLVQMGFTPSADRSGIHPRDRY
ncbi:hypothetical protein [Novosphingobium sp. ZW T3_23]|uniref:hypothetical protein n=1 Tax=Novosphingobium sp. ZW T3_23 TaxID=3378084 RepID=UPI003854FE75